MNCKIVFMDNGESYEDNQSLPVVVCADEKTALKYIDNHPINDESFKKVFHYNYCGRGKYFIDTVEIYTGK